MLEKAFCLCYKRPRCWPVIPITREAGYNFNLYQQEGAVHQLQAINLSFNQNTIYQCRALIVHINGARNSVLGLLASAQIIAARDIEILPIS